MYEKEKEKEKEKGLDFSAVTKALEKMTPGKKS